MTRILDILYLIIALAGCIVVGESSRGLCRLIKSKCHVWYTSTILATKRTQCTGKIDWEPGKNGRKKFLGKKPNPFYNEVQQ